MAFEGISVNVEKMLREKQDTFRELVIGELKTSILDDGAASG